MAHGFSEDIVEEAGIEVLKALGWVHFHGTSIAPDGPSPQRLAFSEVILLPRLEKALGALNPHAPEAARTEAVRLLLTAATGSLVEENRRVHRMLTEGVSVQYRDDAGAIVSDKLWLIGGNLPAQDHDELRALGFRGVFPTGSKLDAICDYIREQVK